MHNASHQLKILKKVVEGREAEANQGAEEKGNRGISSASESKTPGLLSNPSFKLPFISLIKFKFVMMEKVKSLN